MLFSSSVKIRSSSPGAALAALFCAVAGPALAAQQNPVERCRQTASGEDAYVACLEEAVIRLMGVARQQHGDEVSDLGVEQVESRLGADRVKAERRTQTETSTIADFTTTKAGYFVIFLENGQIWRQRKSDSVRVRLSKKKDYTVEIYRSPVSGYRMKIPATRKAIIVERLK